MITYADYGDLWEACRELALRLPQSIDSVAGVPSSGLAPAGMVASLLKVPCVPIHEIPEHFRHTLILEDSTQGMRFKAEFAPLFKGRKVMWGAVYASKQALSHLDIYAAVADKPRVWAWNLYKYILSHKFAFDLDGVLCRDPTKEENDDGEKYRHFCISAPAYIRGGMKCGAIVTNRLEKYRRETEAWLKLHNVRYGQLVMSQHADAGARRKAKDYAQQKAEWYKRNPGMILFVESHPQIAEKIAALSGKSVVCPAGGAWNVKTPSIPSCKPEPATAAITGLNRRIMYTVACGYHALNPPVFENVPDGWDTRVLTDADCPLKNLTPKEMVTWFKTHGPELFSNYDASLCLDDDMTRFRHDPMTWLKDAEWAQVYVDIWGTVKKDLAGLIHNKILDPRLTADDIPKYGELRNRLTGFLYRRHTLKVRELSVRWWECYQNVKTRRDQPALAQAMHEMRYEPTEISNETRKKICYHDKWRGVRHGWRIAYDQPKPSIEEARRDMARLKGKDIYALKRERGLPGQAEMRRNKMRGPQKQADNRTFNTGLFRRKVLTKEQVAG